MEKIELKSPKGQSKFRKYWNYFIEDVSKRDNFCKSHLKQLEILCDLHVQYDEIATMLKKEGLTYETEGRNGFQIKPHPALTQYNKIIVEIRNYHKNLGLVMNKVAETPEEETNEWMD